MSYTLIYHKKTIADKANLKAAHLLSKVEKLCEALVDNPKPQNSKELIGALEGQRSIRINLKHRLVYEIVEDEKLIKILSLWGHYK